MYYENSDTVSAHSGFPNPATDTDLRSIDLNRSLIQNPASTYMMRVSGDQWTTSGIFDGDIAIIDRALLPKPNDIVAWWHDGSFIMSPRHKTPPQCEIWGVITTTIHQFRKKDTNKPSRPM